MAALPASRQTTWRFLALLPGLLLLLVPEFTAVARAQQSPQAPSPDKDRDNKRGDICAGCGVDIGGGFAGPGNESLACAPTCLTARISFGGHSDLLPIGVDGSRRPGDDRPTRPGRPATTTGAAGGTGDPPPPTLDEALATCPAPGPPVLGRNPDPEGVTGLETYLWAEPQSAQSGRAQVRGHPVACTLTPVRWTWTSGDGATYTRTRPGGPHPDNPAGHVYETKGDYTMTLTVDWQADTSLGTATLSRTTERDYHVFEVRSVRTG